MSTTPIPRAAVQAMADRAKQLVLTTAWIGNADNLRFAQGSLGALTSLLQVPSAAEFLARRDASVGGYQPATGFQAAWAALPVGAKNFTLVEVQEFLRSHGVQVTPHPVANSHIDTVRNLKNSEVPPIDLNDKHDAARADVNNGSGLHTAAPVVDATILPPAPGQHWPAQSGTYLGIAPAEGDLPARHLVALDIEAPTKLNWANAVTWATGLGNGARLPTQFEAMIAFTIAKSTFKKEYHWTGTQYSSINAFALVFEYGDSYWLSKSNEFRVRPFRGLALQTFTPLSLQNLTGEAGPQNFSPAGAA